MSVSVEDVASWLGDLVEHFQIEEVGEYIKATPKNFLGSDRFNKAKMRLKQNSAVEYISAGKHSHFKIPKVPENKIPNLEQDSMVRNAIDLMEKALTLLRKAGY